MADAKTDEIRNFVVGPIQTNCYAYVSGGACMVVDPGAAGAAVAEHLADVRVECVVATHGHGDHVGGVAALVAATRAPFCINAAVAERAIPNCHIVFVTGDAMRAQIEPLYQLLYDANPASVGGALPDDAFYYVP